MDEDTEYLKLPTDERCQHKLWKARVNGYEEAAKLFSTIGDEKSSEFSKYLGLIKKFVVDQNAIAQEKGVEAAFSYVENAAVAGKTCSEVVSGIVTKCLHARQKTKDKALEVILMYIEIEKQEIVQEELIKGLSNKNPKIVAVCIEFLRTALRLFGLKVINLKLLVKQIPKLLEERDKNVRDEAKLLTVEVYRWIGAALKPQLQNLKPVQLTELETEFDKLSNERVIPARYLRSQQDLRIKIEQQANHEDRDDNEECDEDEAIEVDPYDLLDPVDILSKLPKEFFDKCEAKKWQERKEAVDNLQTLTANPKLEAGDYSEVIRILKKILAKDSNVLVIVVACKCLTGLAIGLRKKFSPYANSCVESILEKFKEKKQNVVLALREAIDAVYLTTTLETISENVIISLSNKNPAIKSETALFLTRCFKRFTPATLTKKLLKPLVVSLIKTLNDTDPGVRDTSAEALGTAMKVVGEKVMTPFIQDIDNLKQAKVKECFDKAELIFVKTSKSSVDNSAPKTSQAVKRPSVSVSSDNIKKIEDKKPSGKVIQGGPPKKRPNTAPPAKGKLPCKKSSVPVVTDIDEPLERELSDEQVEEKAAEFLTPDILEGLLNSNWKERLTAVDKFTEIVKSMDKNDIPTQVFVRVLAKKNGLKDTNFQVLKARLDMLAYLAENSKFTKTSVNICLSDIADKIGDTKNGATVMTVLTAISEATSLGFVNQQVIKMAFEQKNPKNQSEALNWLSGAIKDFGFQINMKNIIEYVKKALGATNPAVRVSAITLLGVIYMYMGPTLRVFFEDEKPALLQQIDAEFEKMQGVNPPAPTRGLVLVIKGGDDGESEEMPSGTAINVADLIPRNDISGLISPLITELGDKNWKIRGEALSKLANILSDAKFITPNLGDLPSALIARLGDSNKNLATQAVTICQTLGTSMGPNISKHVRTFAPGLIGCLGDNKNTVRSAALSALNAWFEQCGLVPFVEGELLNDSLKLENPYIRSELLGWLSEKLPTVKSLPSDLNLCVPSLLACLEDRNADVRKKAQDALIPFMIHVGYDTMIRATSKLKPASKTQITSLLEKAKPNLPVKEVAVKKPVIVKAMTNNNNNKEDGDKESNHGSSGSKSTSNASKSKMKPAHSKTKLNMIGKGKTGKKEEELDLTPIILAGSKEQRFTDEVKLKVLKWNFTIPRDEFVEQLKDQMQICFSKSLLANMFHADFKFHIKAIDILAECVRSNREATIGALDLILKWLTLRFFETNPSVLLKGLEYLQILFSALDNEDYHMYDLEASSFIPYLILKAGDPKDAVRKDVKAILKLICKVYPASKMFNFVMEGLKSKNSRQRAECLDELGSLIENFGINVCQPNPNSALKIIAQQISDRDNSVRNAALNTMVQAYMILGENIYKFVGNIADKDMALLEERIKRSAKSRPAPVINPKIVNDDKPPRVTRIPSTAQVEPQKSTVNLRNTPKAVVRPASGAFSLDLEKIDVDHEHVDPLVPNLVDLDIDYIYNEPVKLPETRLRPPSPALKMLNNSPDASSALDLVITQVASNDINISVQALAQIDEFLKDEEKTDIMCNHVDQLLLATSLQIRMAYTKHMGDELTKTDDVIKLYRGLTTTLVALFNHRQLAKKASKDVLRDLVHNLITILLDTRLMELEDGPQVVRSVNVMVVKIVEKADHTNIMSALIKLLQDCVANETCSAKFVELIMKCLWKIVRMLPNVINELNLDRILNDLHLFLKVFPSYTWKERTSDIPLRTIKTIIHSLAKLTGNKIMSHLTGIDNLQDSEIEPYLQKVLKSGVLRKSIITNEQNNNGESNPETRSSSREGKNSPRRLSKTTHDILAEIFKKIGSKENTREGLSDLYDFKKKFPEADIEPFLRKSSQFFQNYIERGLKNIEMERDGKLAVVSGQKQTQSNYGVNFLPNTSDSDDTSPAIYMERLKALRARCGLDNTEYEKPASIHQIQPKNTAIEPAENIKALTKSLNHDNGFETSNLNSSFTSTPQHQVVANVEELRKRLERIKNATKS